MHLTSNIIWIRRLIWTYFFLLLFEGVLRKWVVPSLANPLLIVRAPIVIVIYLIAIQSRIFPYNRWVLFCALLAFLGLFAGLFALQDTPAVVLYGFQADFLHLPLIFVIPLVFNIQDAKRVGFWILVFAIPMAMLMVLQFESPSTAWINAGAGEGSTQIGSAEGHIRPASTFSYISGPIAFFPLALAFLLSSQLSNIKYPSWLLTCAPLSIVIAVGVSGSRTLMAFIGIELIFAVVVGTVLQPFLVSQRLVLRAVVGLLVIFITLFTVSQFSVFGEGITVINERVEGADRVEGSFFSRAIGYITKPLDLISDTPLLGYGLGMGTNAGSALITGGQATFLLAEGEWARVILESGPVLGVAFLVLRASLVIWIGWHAAQTARQGNTLPFLIFGSCCTLILTGQFGQPTELGFAVFGGGLTLAAMRWLPVLSTPSIMPLPAMVSQVNEEAA